MSSPDQTAKEKVISLFLDGLGPTQMFQQLLKEGVKMSRNDMNNIVYGYMDSLPGSINDVDCTNMSSEQIDNLKSVINGKLEIDTKIHRFEAMKEEVVKLRQSMAKLYPEKLYAPELALVSNAIQYAFDVGVPRYLIKKMFKNLNSNPNRNVWSTKKVSDYRNLRLKPPGVY